MNSSAVLKSIVLTPGEMFISTSFCAPDDPQSDLTLKLTSSHYDAPFSSSQPQRGGDAVERKVESCFNEKGLRCLLCHGKSRDSRTIDSRVAPVRRGLASRSR